jgi:hypothetical protein
VLFEQHVKSHEILIEVPWRLELQYRDADLAGSLHPTSMPSASAAASRLTQRARSAGGDVPLCGTYLAAPGVTPNHAHVIAAGQFLVPDSPSIWTFALPLLVIFGIIAVIAVDASRRNGSGLAWGLVAFVLGPIGWLLYLLFRPSKRVRATE